MSLEELKGKRRKWVEANRENDFEKGIERLLTDLYPDNAHFIYELLQNAEDARATEVHFILKKDGVEFEHDGKLFTLEDVKSITSLGDSAKKDGPTNIGKFGVGFKAVFAYTKTPEVTSGKYHFRIRDLVVPDTEGLSSCVFGENETRFSFPFDNPQKSPENACTEIEKNLRQLDESGLLFLSNIQRIEYLLPDSSLGFLERRRLDENRIEILVQHPEDSKPVPVLFLRFQKTVGVNDENNRKNCRIAIAFGLEKGKEDAKKLDIKRKQPPAIQWRIKPLKPGWVSIYFPAEKETSNLRFHLHAPFASTVARDSVRDCEANDELRDHLADLIAESMTNIRDQGLLTVEFLATLPNEKDSLSPFYEPILERLIQAFRSEKLTPMKRGGHAAAEGVFRGQRRLSDLIVDDDLATLLGEEHSPPLWVANPPQRNQREYNFLSMLDIPEWTAENLVSRLDELDENDQAGQIIEWLSEKSEAWHGDLYSLLGDELLNDDSNFQDCNYKMLFQRLPVVRISDGTSPYCKGRDCFFPDEDVKHDPTFPRVAKDACSSGKTRVFLKSIGVRELGEVERVEAILRQRYLEEPIEPRKQDMERFITLVEKEPERARKLFRSYYIFQLESGTWGKPSEVYLDSPYLDTGLKAYYEACANEDRKLALSPQYKKSGIALKRIAEFAEKVGAQKELEPEEQAVPCDHPEKSKLKDSGGWSDSYGINQDYDLREFDALLLRPPALNKAELIWKTMDRVSAHVLEAHYRSNSRYYTQSANSTLVHKLRKHSWVPQKLDAEEKLCFVKPAGASADRLPSGFPFDNGAEWLKAIEFGKAEQDRKEEERQREEQNTQEYRRKSELVEGIGFSSVEEAKEMLELKRKDPEGFKKWQDSNKEKARFPTSPAANPDRRRQKVSQEHADSPEKKYETRERSVRATRGTIDPDTWLRNKYTNESGQMICQICEEQMPFRKRNGEHYFETVEALSKEHFNKEHESQFLALCPLCAAMYKEFVKRDEDENVMQEVKNKFTESDSPVIALRLGEIDTVRFVETHWLDLKTILQRYNEPSS